MSTGVLETPQYGRQKSQGLKHYINVVTAIILSDSLALVASNVLSINNAMPSTTGKY